LQLKGHLVYLQATLITLLTLSNIYCVLRLTQPPTPTGSENEYTVSQ